MPIAMVRGEHMKIPDIISLISAIRIMAGF